MSFNDEYSERELYAYAGRNNANTSYGPHGRDATMSVQRSTQNNIDFKDSVDEHLGYVRSVVRKDPDRKVLEKRSHQRFISRDD